MLVVWGSTATSKPSRQDWQDEVLGRSAEWAGCQFNGVRRQVGCVGIGIVGGGLKLPHVEVAVLGRELCEKLRKTGKNYSGLCPFHQEKTPSFSVQPEKQFYYCFGCGAGGNVFKFVMQMENLSFPEAVRKVASHYGIDVPDDGGPAGNSSERDATFAMLTAAARFYRAALARSPFGETVRAYLDERGIGAQAQERFFLGAAPR